jgi:hypothetical protein
MTPLNQDSAPLRGVYLATNNILNRHTYMPPVELELAVPAMKRLHTYTIYHAATGIAPTAPYNIIILRVIRGRTVQGAYIFTQYFAKLDDRCILCNEIVHTTFGSTSQEDHDVQTAVGTRVEPPQIPGHTYYARSVRQPFPSNTGLRFYREMAVATIGPFQMLRSLCVIDRNFTILRHFLLKLWRNEILR